MIQKIDSFSDNDVIMTAEEVAQFLKVSVGTIRRWTREGKLKGHKMGSTGDWRYLKKNVLDFLMK